MFGKIVATLVLAYFATPGDAFKANDVWTGLTDAVNEDGLTARWALNRQDGYYPLPLNVNDAKTQLWTELNGADSSGRYTVLRYKGDSRCALYFSKKTGLVRGVRVSVPVADIRGKGIPINYENYTGLYKETLNNVDYYSSSMFFRLNGNDGGGPRIWLRDQEGTHVIPTDTNVLDQSTLYKKKGCITTMGTHYYRLSKSQDCVDVYPWFFLGDGKDLIGFGFQLLGPATRSTDREWFENIPIAGIQFAIPDVPDCLLQEIADVGLISLHFWLSKNVTIFSCNS